MNKKQKTKNGIELPKVAVVIVTWNRIKPLIRNLDALKKSSYPIFQTIVVDNASTDNTIETIHKRYKDVLVIENKKNTGAAAGRNIGAKHSDSPYIFFLDDDAFIEKNAIAECIKTILKSPEIAIVQTMVLSSFDKKKILGIAHDINTTTSRITAFGINETDHGQYKEEKEIPMVGTGWLVNKKMFDEVNGFDEKFFVPYEDSDISLRVRESGYRILFNPKAKIWHDDLKPTEINARVRSIGIASPERAYYVGRNKVYFMRKHAKGWGRFYFFGILLPLFVGYHCLIIISSFRFDILITYIKGLWSGFRL